MSSTILIRVQLLDDTDLTYNIQVNNTGNVVFEAVAKDLNLVEADYFGLLFQDKAGNQAFLNPLKKIKQQLSHAENCTLKFAVKFFPPDPGQLHEEYTRYLFALQVKRDIASGNLVCSGDTFAIMIAYIVQSEFGDWSNAECEDLSYLKELKILPQNYSDDEFLAKTCEEHKNLVGLSPSQADRKLLDVARKLDLYGIHMHSAKDRENTSIQLAVTHEGVVVLRGNAKINTFNWSRVRKLSFKKKRFLVKLKPENSTEGIHGNVGNVIVFLMTSRDACKIFWRHCIEYHAFFRLESRPEPRPQPRFFKRGSTFRYSGRTQRQLQDRVRNSDLKRTDFVRRSHRKYASMRSSRPTPIPTSTQPMYKQSTKIVSKDDTALSNGGRGTNLPLTSVQDKPEVTSNRADEAWQVESKNLHSNAVVSQTRIEPRESDKIETVHHDEVDGDASDDESSSLSSSSSSLLHSSGVKSNEKAEEVVTKPNVPPPSPPVQLSSSALMSTSDLKSTSSVSDQVTIASNVYFIVKELFLTERTYVKDLEVINTCFKSAVQNERLMSENVANQLFGGTGSLLAIHNQFLREVEDKLKMCEGGGDWDVDGGGVNLLIHSHILVLNKYLSSLENAESLINDLENLATSDIKFESAYRDFELQNVCYLPFGCFLLKPMQRVVHYKILIENLLDTHGDSDRSELYEAMKQVNLLVSAIEPRLKRAHNLQKLAQLRRDLIGADNLLNNNREFIREGSLYKLSRKGFEQRLFFLFSDCVFYSSKGVTETNQFKVHAQLPLKNMIVEINEGEASVPNCFSLISGSKTVIVAASSQSEMDKWLEDFSQAITFANKDYSTFQSPLINPDRGSAGHLSSGLSSDDGDDSRRSSMDTPRPLFQQRSNATMHVCWHRNTSASEADHLNSLQNQMSGYLLRKFKNSDGWQKLWVVFSNFCLFFYKSYQDEEPLASLPLLGYSISLPSEEDGISKDCVFKLQYKTHVYFFRAESQYTFNRWHHVICSTTVTSQRTRLFSRLTSS